MSRLERGLYEVLITQALEAQLAELNDSLEPDVDELRAAEAADRIALHVATVLARALEGLSDKDRVAAGTAPDSPVEPAAVLRSIARHLPDGRLEEIAEPLIPLLDTTLLTNSPGEPRVGSQVRAEIHSADRIDLVMAFVRRSGIRPLLDPLRAHCGARGAGRPLRVLTTSTTGSTEATALDELAAAGAEVRVSCVTWHLKHSLSGDLFASFAAAVA